MCKKRICGECKKFQFHRIGVKLMRNDDGAYKGECNMEHENVTASSIACNDFEPLFTGNNHYCSIEHIMDNNYFIRYCKRHDYHCDECQIKTFWEELIYDELHDNENYNHFINNDKVFCFTDNIGGFNNKRFDIVLEDGTVLEDKGLWHNGEVPNKEVHDSLPQAMVKRHVESI